MTTKKIDLCKVEELFDQHDFNKDGTIEYKEVKPLLVKMGCSEKAVEQLSLDLNFLLEADKDGDHKVSLQEFKDYVMKLNSAHKAAKKK